MVNLVWKHCLFIWNIHGHQPQSFDSLWLMQVVIWLYTFCFALSLEGTLILNLVYASTLWNYTISPHAPKSYFVWLWPLRNLLVQETLVVPLFFYALPFWNPTSWRFHLVTSPSTSPFTSNSSSFHSSSIHFIHNWQYKWKFWFDFWITNLRSHGFIHKNGTWS